MIGIIVVNKDWSESANRGERMKLVNVDKLKVRICKMDINDALKGELIKLIDKHTPDAPVTVEMDSKDEWSDVLEELGKDAPDSCEHRGRTVIGNSIDGYVVLQCLD